jgi:hypothetical protein
MVWQETSRFSNKRVLKFSNKRPWAAAIRGFDVQPYVRKVRDVFSQKGLLSMAGMRAAGCKHVV